MYFLEMAPEVLVDEVLSALSQEDRVKLLRALQMAARAHEHLPPPGETRDEGKPPIDHPVRVMYSLFLEQKVRDIDVLVTALLHDVLEISSITVAEIRQAFGDKVAGWVQLLTRRPGLSREAYFEQIRQGPFEVFLIEMAGRLDNLRTAHRRRKSLQPYFNETRHFYLAFAEQHLDDHPQLRTYTEAMRMLLEGD